MKKVIFQMHTLFKKNTHLFYSVAYFWRRPFKPVIVQLETEESKETVNIL